MTDKDLEKIEKLYEKAVHALAKGDAVALKAALKMLAKLALDAQEISTNQEKEMHRLASASGFFGLLFQQINRVLDYPKNKTNANTRTAYPRPLRFGKKWNGKPPKSFLQKLIKIAEVNKYLEMALQENPNLGQTKLANEITKKFKVQNALAHALVKKMKKNY